MEHLHVRYIQLDDAELAQSLLVQIREGADFEQLAQTYSLDRVTGAYGGDLGWFTRGSLLVPEIETVAFQLQEGEVSEVVSANADAELSTYYIIQLLERDPDRLLTSELRHRLLQEAFDLWLEAQRSSASVVSFLDVQS
jgi:parvulin-like peptidyl-prolyl isomerase